ncbi:MAG: GNAT family N-acetyltransferase [Spirochaetes bacterium]|nr:GNAT family N-acetyltransferase [Spirochaetota bacterium]
MNIELRPYAESDLPMLEAWGGMAHCRAHMSRYLPRKFKTNTDEWRLYIITADGTAAGAVWIELHYDTVHYDLGIMIGDERMLGKGIGRSAVMQAVCAARKVFNYDAVYLNVRRDNERAIRCYTAVGFVIVDAFTRRYDDGTEVQGYRMELKVR